MILVFRVLQLSGVWEAAYARVLKARKQPQIRTEQPRIMGGKAGAGQKIAKRAA